MQYRYLFFDLDHTLWDFETNSKHTLTYMYHQLQLQQHGVHSVDLFHAQYNIHNNKLWERYRNGFIKVDELRWKRMWHTLLDFKIGDEKLAKQMAVMFLDLLPNRTALFAGTVEILDYLANKNYQLHLITNGFEEVQHSKLKHSGISKYFDAVITSESSNSLKPHAAIFDYALQKTKATKQQSIMLGDNLEADIAGAMNAGWDQVFVNHLNEQTFLQPTFTVYNLKELENIF
jgi:putative hydrolase of the HAD superfamily